MASARLVRSMFTSAATKCFRSSLNGFPLGFPFKLFQVHRISNICQGCRTLLSASYVDQDTWRQRKKLDTNMNELSIKLDKDFYDDKRPVTSVELHKFIDNMVDADDVEIGQGYLYCHRHSIVAPHLRESTRHSWIRGCLDHKRQDIALQTLQDRVSITDKLWLISGFIYIQYIYRFLSEEKGLSRSTNIIYIAPITAYGGYCSAMVAVEMMHQEVIDVTEPLTQLLCLYACHMHLTNGLPVQDETYNIGMTLADASRGLTSLLGRSYHAVGYAMTGRLDKVLKLFENLDENELCVTQEAVDKVKAILDTQDPKDEEMANQFQDTIERLQSQSKISPDSLDSLVSSQLLNLIPEYEKNDHVGYAEQLQQWHREHTDDISRRQASEEARIVEAKKARLEELLMEVEENYVKQKIEEDVRKHAEQMGVDNNTAATT